MTEFTQAHWIALAAVVVAAILIAWWLFSRATRGERIRHRAPDVLDEGAAPAQRNQAFIDAPPAVAIVPPAAAGVMGGIGEVVAAAVSEEVIETVTDAPAGEGDDLRRIKGVGPKLVALLHSLDVTRYAQIAAWTDADIDRMDAQLGSFAGRIRRDNWVEQARLLASGDTGAFEAKFGKV